MATGLLYDVHGNLPALEAVLTDARATDVDHWVLGGDYASFGAWPSEVLELLDALPRTTWLRGNWERWQAADEPDFPDDAGLRASLAAVRSALDPARISALGALPAMHADRSTIYCHASPRSDVDPFALEPEPADDERLRGLDARLVVFGHTHAPLMRDHRGTMLVNPGSVGAPMDGDVRAAWAILHDDGQIEHRRVDYDVDAAVHALTSRFGRQPWVEQTVACLQAASFRV